MVPLPASIKTNSPQEVVDAVVRAVEQNRAEVDVAAARGHRQSPPG